MVLNRKGMPEECFFKLTYSPVPGGLPGTPVSDMAPPGGVLMTVAEITELVNARRREAERVQLKEALQAKRIELLEEVFRTAPSFLHVLRGPDFIFEFANDAYYQLVGRRELIGQPGVRGTARDSGMRFPGPAHARSCPRASRSSASSFR